MSQDLLAPPKLTVRAYAKVVIAFSLLAIVIGIVLVFTGTIGVGELVRNAAMIAVLSTLAIWAYSALVRAAKTTLPQRMPLLHAGVTAIGFAAFGGSIALMLRGTPVGFGQQLLWMLPFMTGMMLAMGGWGRRVGDSMHCPECEYEFRFDDQSSAPNRCPECGVAWIGRLNKGRRVRSARMMASGIAIALFAMVVLNPIFYLGSIGPHLPTPILYAVLYFTPKHADTSWNELSTRSLDPRWTRIMAERVLKHRAQDANDSGPAQWFELTSATASIPDDLVERFYREGVRADLVVPERVKRGEQFAVKLRVHHVAAYRSSTGLMFAGYAIGDEAPRRGRQAQTVWAHELRPGVFSRHRDVLSQQLTIAETGDVRVRVVYWVVYQPSFLDELKWQADGTPVLPGNATWFERFEIEKTVRVE